MPEVICAHICVPCTGSALIFNVESCHSEQAGGQPCHAFSSPAETAEMAAPMKVTGCFSVAPNASQKEASLHLPKILHRFILSHKGQATGYEHVLYS